MRRISMLMLRSIKAVVAEVAAAVVVKVVVGHYLDLGATLGLQMSVPKL